MSIVTKGVQQRPYSAKIGPKKSSIRDFLPKEKYCEHCTILPTLGRPITQFDNYCPNCGTKLSERLGDIYIQIYYSDSNPNEFPENLKDVCPKEQCPRGYEPKGQKITLKDLVRLIEIYKRETVIEDL